MKDILKFLVKNFICGGLTLTQREATREQSDDQEHGLYFWTPFRSIVESKAVFSP